MIVQAMPYPPALSGGALVTRSNTSFSSTSGAPVSWAATVYDNGGWFNGTSKLIAPSSGLVRVIGNVNGAASQIFRITKGGADFVGASRSRSNTSGDNDVNLTSAIISASALDEFELVKDDTTTTAPASASSNWFGIERLDPSTKYALLCNSTSQSRGSNATITFDTETADVGGWANLAGSNTNVVVPSGVSRVRVSGAVDTANTGLTENCLLTIQKGGALTTQGLGVQQENYNGAKYLTVATAVLDVVPGDIFSLGFSNTSSVTVNAARTWLCIEEVPDYARTVVYRNATTSISANTTTPIPWTHALTDTAGAFGGSGTTSLTTPSGVSECRISFSCDSQNSINSALLFIGGTIGGRAAGAPSEESASGSCASSGLGMWRPCSPGDTIQLNIFSAAQTLPISVFTWLCVEWR